MDNNLNPGSIENALLTLSQVVIGGVSYGATITDSHLILTNTESGNRDGSIPLTSIEHATATSNRLREPVIRLSVLDPAGGAQEIELIFPHIAGGRDIRTRDATVILLKNRGVAVTIEPEQALFPLRTGKESMDAGTGMATDDLSDRTTVPDWTRFGIAHSSGAPQIKEPEPHSPLFTITAVILLAALCIAAMVMPLPAPKEDAAFDLAMERAIQTTPTVTIAPQTSAPSGEQLLPHGSVPGNGIYAKISCPGSYAGFISAGGWRMDVNSSGTQVYQLPVQNTVIEVFIEKHDGSSDILAAEIYNGGVPVAQQKTAAPRGLVEMHVAVGPAVEGITLPAAESPSAVAAVTKEPVATPAALVQYAIPTTGVWVHVAYPGNYTGSLSSNGVRREIVTSGDQIYQVTIRNGTIDGILEKGDGSLDPLQIEVFKDGTRIDLANTTAPKGIAEIHTRL